jgi:short-subunit dehydrogenase
MQISKGSKAIVIGASYGIGLSVAEQLVKMGVHTGIIARNRTELEKAEIGLKKLAIQGQVVQAANADATHPEALKVAVDTLIGTLGGIDLVIHCVGRAVPQYFEKITNAQFDQNLKTNLSSAWYAIKAVLPHMKGRGGTIVIVSSICGFLGVYGYSDYCAAKFGLVGLAESLQYELSEHNIKVQLVFPPDTDTPGYAEENKTKPKETLAVSANAKLLHPEQVASEIITGIRKGRDIIIPGADGKLTYLVKRWFPGLVKWIMRRDILKAQRQ